MRSDHEIGSEIYEDLAGVTIELENWRDRIRFAVHWFSITEATCSTAFVSPYVPVMGIDVDSSCGPPLPSFREITPVRDDRCGRVHKTVACDEVAT
jgi:hypothetical protein